MKEAEIARRLLVFILIGVALVGLARLIFDGEIKILVGLFVTLFIIAAIKGLYAFNHRRR